MLSAKNNEKAERPSRILLGRDLLEVRRVVEVADGHARGS
jgi:hypothetical protein